MGDLAARLGASTHEVERVIYQSLRPFVARDWSFRWYLREQMEEPPGISEAASPEGGESELGQDMGVVKSSPGQPETHDQFLAWLGDALRWAGTEGGLASLGELLEAAGQPGVLPNQLTKRWIEALERPLREESSIGMLDPFGPVVSWFRSLDTRRQTILTTRSLLLDNERTLQEIASDFGVSRERIRQLEVGLLEDLDRRASSDEWELARWRAHTIKRVAGIACPSGYPPLEELLIAASPLAAAEAIVLRGLMLRLAGPYQLDGEGWYLSNPEGLEEARERVLQRAEDQGGLDSDLAAEVLVGAGLAPGLFRAWLDRGPGLRELRGKVIPWPRSLGGRVEALLKFRNEPASPDEILKDLGDDVDMRSLRTRLSSDVRFVRVDRARWGLGAWGLPEYVGIVAAISEALKSGGSSVSVEELVGRLSSSLGVAEASVAMLCNAPRFFVEDGLVRFRREDEPYPVNSDLACAGGVFQLGPRKVSILIDVDSDLLRGSGGAVPEQVAAILTIAPGDDRAYSCKHGGVRLSWPDTSISGPAIGSLRRHAERLGSVAGDSLRVSLDDADCSASVSLVAEKRVQELDGEELITEVVGVEGSGGALYAKLAQAVGANVSDLAGVLRRRGDVKLADALPEVTPSKELEEELRRLADLFEL